MSYVTYTTEALVCGSFDQNTADKSFLLFTRDAGMLFATAKSVREERSLQRPALQDFSRIRVSLIKGKTGWRVGSVEALQNDFSLAKDRLVRASVVAVFRTLRRFIRGEEAFPELFAFVIAVLDAALGEPRERQLFDLAVQVRILAMLGYVDEAVIPKTIAGATVAALVEIDDQSLAVTLTKLIAKATESSHL
jgi:recombinational DNA repair protein (RecF pathway)